MLGMGQKSNDVSVKGVQIHVVNGGVRIKHGAQRKRCSSDGCASNAVREGVCTRHGGFKLCNILQIVSCGQD